MNTYINDKKLAEYPFYETGADAPPPGCIRYLGVCLKGATASPVYASAITVGMDGVLVSLCRDPDEEIIGTVYATAAEGTVSMELSGSTVPGTASMLIDKTMLSNSYGTYTGKFYLDPSCVTYMEDNVAGNLKTVNVNGTTYAASQGIDFTCMGSVIEFEPEDITGSTVTEVETVLLKGSTAVNSFALVASNPSSTTLVDSVNEITLADASRPYPTLTLKSEYILSKLSAGEGAPVVAFYRNEALDNVGGAWDAFGWRHETSITNIDIWTTTDSPVEGDATYGNVYHPIVREGCPVAEVHREIEMRVVRGSKTDPADLVLELNGTTAFPNCYVGKGDEA